MKQIIQDLKNGETILEEVPVPQVKPGQVLIQTTRSLVSLGTERMLVEFGKSNLFQKAKQQPDKVKEVINKIKTDGLQPTINAVFNKLGQPVPIKNAIIIWWGGLRGVIGLAMALIVVEYKMTDSELQFLANSLAKYLSSNKQCTGM